MKEDINNYRPITLMSNIYKLFSTIITKRITPALDENQSYEQAGFRKGFSTADHLQTLTQLIEKIQEFNQKLYIAFIDFAKAFDSVERIFVLKTLKKQGVQEKYIRIIGKMYLNNKARIKMDRTGKEFELTRGVRQGDPSSPKLFTAVLEEIFRRMKLKYGISIDGKKLFNLRFADDIVLISESHKELTNILQELYTYSKEIGLKINTNKTKIMTNSVTLPTTIDKTVIEYTDEYIYLGQIVSFKDKINKEIDRRISLAWKKFWGLKFILLDRSLPLKIKQHVMDTCILPVMLYGAQTWTLNKHEKNMLSICQRKMERKLLGVSLMDKIRNTIIRDKSKIKDVIKTADCIKWKWGGHIIRLTDDRWTHRVTIWDQRRGKRSVGRQRTRWEDDFKRELGRTWTRTARRREEWRAAIK